ncbi:DUF5134 domain-containing protein [Streptomyces sp. NPDC050560]|uniref:DUF5134 domain-containing protein n=1 Tax=Streptomyces sp. NPDC050560 TaxID=3365630 RepID=UPI0037A36781
MLGPAPVAWLLVALCAASGGYCLLRLRSGVEEQRRAAGLDTLMAFGMAAMAVPAAALAAPRGVWIAMAAVFAAAALRTLWPPHSAPRHLHHLVGAGAMAYMAALMAAMPAGHAGHMAHGGGPPLLTGALLLYFAGHALLAGARLIPVATAGGPPVHVAWGDRPELARVCGLTMSLGMVAMLGAL